MVFRLKLRLGLSFNGLSDKVGIMFRPPPGCWVCPGIISDTASEKNKTKRTHPVLRRDKTRSAGFLACRIAAILACNHAKKRGGNPLKIGAQFAFLRIADWKVGDTADAKVCATRRQVIGIYTRTDLLKRHVYG
jgi:hypothetical protein